MSHHPVLKIQPDEKSKLNWIIARDLFEKMDQIENIISSAIDNMSKD